MSSSWGARKTSLCDNNTGQSLLDRSGLNRSSDWSFGGRDWLALISSPCMFSPPVGEKEKGKMVVSHLPFF
jgi:hypothetical protein